MARQLTSQAQTDNEIARIEREADHHAPHVMATVRLLYNYVIQRIDFTRDRVEIYERNGAMARTTWVTFQGRRYVFTYNYSTTHIDLRDGSIKGNTLIQFNGTETAEQVASVLAPHFP